MDAINQMFDQDYNEFRNSVNDILIDKLQGRIDNERINVGQAIFVDETEEDDIDPATQFEEDEDISDEEV